MLNRRSVALVAVLSGTLVLAACGEKKTTPNEAAPSAPSAAASSGPLTPAAGGKVVEVEMITDGEGSYFKPAQVHASRGDVVRFTLKVGVHNVHFLADSNAGKTGLPAASEFLQLPGQTHDVAVGMDPGTYFFQCDPHAALGMKGHLVVH